MAIDNLFVRQSEMTKGETYLGQLKYRVFVVPWLCAHATFDVTCFLAFVRASAVISNILSKLISMSEHVSLVPCSVQTMSVDSFIFSKYGTMVVRLASKFFKASALPLNSLILHCNRGQTLTSHKLSSHTDSNCLTQINFLENSQ